MLHVRFRADLQVIQTAIMMWNDGDVVQESLKLAARSSVLHCKALVDNVMDVTKFKSGCMRLAAVDFSLRALCTEVHRTMTHAFPNTPQLVHCAASYRVNGSPRHLKQVLQPVKLLQNTVSDRARCIAQLRPGSSFLLSALRFP